MTDYIRHVYSRCREIEREASGFRTKWKIRAIKDQAIMTRADPSPAKMQLLGTMFMELLKLQQETRK